MTFTEQKRNVKDMKRCGRCNTEKSKEEFYKNKSTSDGLAKSCKVCSKRMTKEWRAKDTDSVKKWKKESRLRVIARKYGLSEDEYLAMVKAANGCCEICGVELESPHLDHNHITGKARGILCMAHNTGIGFFNDDVDLLQKAIDYLNSRDSSPSK